MQEWTAVKMNDLEQHLTSTNVTQKRLIGDDIIYIKFSIMKSYIIYLLFRKNNKDDSTFRKEINSSMPNRDTEDLTEKNVSFFLNYAIGIIMLTIF